MNLNAEVKSLLNQAVESYLDELHHLYRHLHAHPELSGQEAQTAARMAKELEAAGCRVHTGIGGHGVAGVLDNGPGPCVLLRADMDALPLTETTGLPFASTVKAELPDKGTTGVMHACGHDAHMTCLVGAAGVLSQLRRHFSGKMIFVAQPAEEAIGGAALMMKDGLYNRTGRPDFALALHVRSELEEGCVGLGAGVRSSASNALDIIVKGLGGHAASPHLGVDPVVLSAQLILALQTIVSRQINPREMGIITVGALHAGSKRNIIPDRAVLNLTIRSYDAAVGRRMVEAVKRTADGLAMAAGLPQKLWPEVVQAETPYPPVINDPELTGRMEAVFKDLLGKQNVRHTPKSSGSEDFGELGLADPPIPTMMYHLGVTRPERLALAEKGEGRVAAEHDPGFHPDLEKGLPTGILTMAGAALALLAS